MCRQLAAINEDDSYDSSHRAALLVKVELYEILSCLRLEAHRELIDIWTPTGLSFHRFAARRCYQDQFISVNPSIPPSPLSDSLAFT